MAEQVKKLYRAKNDRVIFGVCGGLGKYFGIDPVWLRVAFVLFALVDGVGILVYLIMAVVIPEDKNEEVKGESKALIKESVSKKWYQNPRNLLGSAIIALGMVLLFNQFFPMSWHWLRWEIIWAVLIIGIGAFIILKNTKKK
ncbi:MAG: PspC domain-containing protein [Patescibacteria group bacterium]|jgi:phage shock protein PspC (stress-responsive transcriptional regulator)